jgi:hypothetical protein
VSGPHWHADIEVGEAEDGWVMTARLPGFTPEDIHLDVTDRELTIAAVRPGDEPTADFAYRLAVPSDADPDAIEASMQGDLLAVRMPRLRRYGPRRIAVRRCDAESPDGTAADESMLGPSPGSVTTSDSAAPGGPSPGSVATSGAAAPPGPAPLLRSEDVEVIRPTG